jgi:uncharacterized protein YegL
LPQPKTKNPLTTPIATRHIVFLIAPSSPYSVRLVSVEDSQNEVLNARNYRFVDPVRTWPYHARMKTFSHRTRWLSLALTALWVLVCSTGCSEDDAGQGAPLTGLAAIPVGSCLDFQVLDGVGTTPSDLMLFFSLETCEGVPVIGVQNDEFKLLENEQPISLYESNMQILPRCTGFDLLSVLLLDMSGSVVDSGNLPLLINASKDFIERLTGQQQQVAVYLFDGRPQMQLLVDFTTDKEELYDALNSLTSFVVQDNSTNLNGALIDTIAMLNEQKFESNALVHHSSIVVFTDGSDQAAIVDNESASAEAYTSDYEIYTVGLGIEVDEDHLTDLGTAGAFFATDSDEISDAFNTVANDILKESQKYYVIGYCSPKRAGTHSLTLEIEGYFGALNAEFEANEFSPGCNAESIVENAKLQAKACADTTVFTGTGQFFD